MAVFGFIFTFRDMPNPPHTEETGPERGSQPMTTTPGLTPAEVSALTAEDEGYHKGLKPRQIQMIAIGGAIGTGLFLGAGARLANAGPGLFLVYGFCGVFVFFILRAMGELVLHRPSSGSFVSYAREFLGERAAYVAGWMYFLNWAMTHRRLHRDRHLLPVLEGVPSIPQWAMALIALAAVLSINLVSVTLFGNWVLGRVDQSRCAGDVLVAATVFLGGRYQIDGHSTGFSIVMANNGGLSRRVLPLVIVVSGVVFAYAAVELVGIVAGETAEPEKSCARHQLRDRPHRPVLRGFAVSTRPPAPLRSYKPVRARS